MLCFLLFVVYMVGMVALGIVAFVQDGLTEKAIYLTEGVDFRGRGCGPSGAVFFPHYQTNPDFGVCVTSCPIQGINVDVTLPVLSSAAWVNVSDVIASPVPPAVANATTSMSTTFQSVSFPGYDTIKQGYVCAPKEALDAVSADTSQLNDVLGLYIGGIRQNWEPLLYSAGICLGFAIVYLILLRFGGCFILGLSVVSIQVALVVAAAYVWSLSTNDGLDRHAQNILLIVAVFLVCGAMAYFLAVVVLVQRLLLAGKFLVYGTRVFSNMNKMALIPFAYAFALVAVLAWGLSVAVCLFTAGTAVDVEEAIPVESGGTVTVLVRSFQRNTTLRWLFVYHAFGMYWVVSVLLALVDMTVAMAVGVWYFTPTDRQTKAKAFDVADPVQFSMTTIVKYHVGTAAFSALVVAPVRYIRNFFMYIDDHKEADMTGNWFGQLCSTLCCCCIWCFNRFIVFICKESYFITAIEGTSFYSAAKVAHGLITSRILRIGAINRIGNASVLLVRYHGLFSIRDGQMIVQGKTLICSATTAVAWTLMANKTSPSSIVVPMVVVALVSYAIAHTFMTLYETSINVLLLSFALDESMNGGRNRAEFAQADFTKYV
ncbi:hypothetical protein DYB32_006925 [Aphanomyces invadans]|uniref:Choline transporter-like protein n=1 Tax=Aphanomyces invadans TaxID=157072 RepID=A0A418AQ98_9STRA|nr:hypothetical protein DYB32_006925 [Aphanomyces invadans]